MDRRKLLRLWADEELCEQIRAITRQHFSCPEDQEDAFSEAWEKIAKSKDGDAIIIAKRAIKNLYDRIHYDQDPSFRAKVIARVKRYRAHQKSVTNIKSKAPRIVTNG